MTSAGSVILLSWFGASAGIDYPLLSRSISTGTELLLSYQNHSSTSWR